MNSMGLTIVKWLHLIGIMTLFYAYGGLVLGARIAQSREFPYRRNYVLLHGIGMILLLISGLGQVHLLHLTPMPTWVFVKIGVWFVLGGLLSMVLRRPEFNKSVWILILGLGGFAAYLALFKPF